ncbi:hypothetical protein BDK51DRAFT_36240 [Blyttiomyces helicus]|uniref:DNA-directed RNA polymerase subunit n=1 Tax=Blyttiomyces helicus TaxID=388810 RepID=A0A4P9WNW6_9FUNG|nr:hypothetical protein BDK51DRAFT_36240 [Blyttiomyces helicus]|eukprot:RKO94694.1 hypothetical protein BDK51DRAFT_36240 [Blyttiomyces helicus]
MSYEYSHSSAPVRECKNVEFGILSPDEIRQMSFVKIEHDQLYENDKRPKVGGLADPRMGCVDRSERHFGHIELAQPVYHIGFIKTVKKILECVCHRCARFRLLPDDQRYKKLQHVKDKFSFSWNYAKSKLVCEYPDCETQLLPLRRIGKDIFYLPRDKKANRIQLSASDAREILERITDETCRLIGLNPENARPKWMIITVLPVPPPCVRPSVSMDHTGKGEDDLTHMLNNIVRFTLEVNVTNYMDNEVFGVDQSLQKGGRPIESISARLKGKEGRIRGNMMGKRVDFCARSVITGDPYISIEEVGVPKSIAINLTFPETVNALNIEKMQKLVNNSPNYPGARFYFSGVDGKRFGLKKVKIKPRVKIGDILKKHMIDGDYVIFNRQPTLHKMSMMAHHAKVMDYSTFRLNVNVTASYNADFDGDEMNLHMPVQQTTRAELETLMTVSKNLMSSQASKPVNALVQDALCGIRKMTERDVFISKHDLMNMVLWIKDFDGILPQPAIVKPLPLWTGKQIISMILPRIDLKGYHYLHAEKKEAFEKKTSSFAEKHEFEKLSPWDTNVLIDDGELISGIICKKTVGASAGGIVHIIYNDYGSCAARDFMDNAAQVVNYWLLHHGFSVDTQKHIQKTIQKQCEKGRIIPRGSLSIDETKENNIQDFLAKARDISGKLANESLPKFNNIKQMVEAGSKGSILNICQISANVGQQIVDGKRIPWGFKYRTLPSFSIFDDSPESRGFVMNSFITGLTPQELFFHAMGGREGLIDTAVKTAETGYIQRRLVKALEDLIIKYDGTVRNSRNDLFQFYYGEDGFDGNAIERQTFPTMLLPDFEFERDYYNSNLEKSEWIVLQLDRKFLRDTMRIPEDNWPLPLNIKRMITRAGNDNPSMLFGILVQSLLSSRQVIERWKLNKEAFSWLLAKIEEKYYRGLIHPGESVRHSAIEGVDQRS